MLAMHILSPIVGAYLSLLTWIEPVTAVRPAEKEELREMTLGASGRGSSMSKPAERGRGNESFSSRQVRSIGSLRLFPGQAIPDERDSHHRAGEGQGAPRTSFVQTQSVIGEKELRGLFLAESLQTYLVRATPRAFMCSGGHPIGPDAQQAKSGGEHLPLGEEVEKCKVPFTFQLINCPRGTGCDETKARGMTSRAQKAANQFMGSVSSAAHATGHWSMPNTFFEGEISADPWSGDEKDWLRFLQMPWQKLVLNFNGRGAEAVILYDRQSTRQGWWTPHAGKQWAFRLDQQPHKSQKDHVYTGVVLHDGVTSQAELKLWNWEWVVPNQKMRGKIEYRLLDLPFLAMPYYFAHVSNIAYKHFECDFARTPTRHYECRCVKTSCNDYSQDCPFAIPTRAILEFTEDFVKVTEIVHIEGSDDVAIVYLMWPIWRDTEHIVELARENRNFSKADDPDSHELLCELKIGQDALVKEEVEVVSSVEPVQDTNLVTKELDGEEDRPGTARVQTNSNDGTTVGTTVESSSSSRTSEGGG